MKCKVCRKTIEAHDIDAMLKCLGDPSAPRDYNGALGWAQRAGFLEGYGSDGGLIVLKFKNADKVVTRFGAEAIYGHYLTKLKPMHKESESEGENPDT